MLENLENYKVFYFIGKHLNITKAAGELFLSQPTVTKEIHAFEERLGCKLFVRASKGVRLTPEGQLLYDQIAPLVERLMQAEFMIKRLGTHDEGVISIGVNRKIVSILMQPFLAQFKQQHPRLDMVYTVAERNVLDAMLEHGLADIALSYRPYRTREIFTQAEFETKHHPTYSWKPDVEIYHLMTCGYIVVVRPDMMKHFPGDTVCASDLYEFPLILQVDNDPSLEKALIHLLRRDGKLTLRDHVIADPAYCVNMLLLTGGVGVASEPAVADELKQGRLVPLYLKEPLPQRELVLFYSAKAPLRGSARELKSYLMKQKAFDVKYVAADDKFQQT